MDFKSSNLQIFKSSTIFIVFNPASTIFKFSVGIMFWFLPVSGFPLGLCFPMVFTAFLGWGILSVSLDLLFELIYLSAAVYGYVVLLVYPLNWWLICSSWDFLNSELEQHCLFWITSTVFAISSPHHLIIIIICLFWVRLGFKDFIFNLSQVPPIANSLIITFNFFKFIFLERNWLRFGAFIYCGFEPAPRCWVHIKSGFHTTVIWRLQGFFFG